MKLSSAIGIVTVSLLVGLILGFSASKYIGGNVADTIKDTKKVKTEVTTKKKVKNVTVSSPDGTTRHETTTTTEETNTTATADGHTVVIERSKNHINLLFGFDSQKSYEQVYGLAYQRDVLGPASIGIWGLKNGTVGLSAGVSF